LPDPSHRTFHRTPKESVMAAKVHTWTYSSVSLGIIIYLAVGLIITISQDYWKFTNWDGHEWASLLTAIVAIVFWPISIFYSFVLVER
jgi:hypothetical protein